MAEPLRTTSGRNYRATLLSVATGALFLGGLFVLGYAMGDRSSTQTALPEAPETTAAVASATTASTVQELPVTTFESTTTTVEETTTSEPATTSTTAPPSTEAPTTESTEPSAEVTEPPSAETTGLPTAAQWEALRQCEATGNYSAVNPVGYYGAYQFNQQTWDGIANELGRSDLVGVRPDTVAPVDQDALAQRLWDNRGWQPWPACSAKLGFR